MKRHITHLLGTGIAILALSLTACNRHPQAKAFYLKAEEAFFAGEYQAAQRLIDSIPESDSLAFDWIRKGITLNQRITLEQNRRNLHFIDSLLPLLQESRKEMMPQFRFIKNGNDPDEGRYVYLHDSHAGSAHTTCLRIQLTPSFEAEIISVYCGKAPLHHVAAKIELPDGTYALTPTTPYDGALNYRFTYQNGNHCELVCYRGHELRPVIETIISAKEKPIKVSYEGEFPYSYTLSENDRKAFEQCFRLSSLERRIVNLEREKKIARKTVDLLSRQLAATEGR